MSFDHRLLVTSQGEIDRFYLVQHARARAMRDYGGTNPPPAYVRPHVLNLEMEAYFARRDWRLARGLRDDTEYTVMEVQSA